MRLALLAVLLAGCGAPLFPDKDGQSFYSCDVQLVSDWDNRLMPATMDWYDVRRGVTVALQAASFTTDPRLHDQTENCRKMMGWRIYTKKEAHFEILTGQGMTMVDGFSQCVGEFMVIGTPASGKMKESAFVHELFHVMQDCHGTPPEDPGVPAPFHDNWFRDGIFNAIDWAETQP